MQSLAIKPAGISTSQAEHFAHEGWCVVDGLFSVDQIDAIEQFIEVYKTKGAAVYDYNMRIDEIDPKQQQVRAMHPHRGDGAGGGVH